MKAPLLPAEFLCTALAGRGADEPVVRIAGEHLRSAQSRPDRSALAEALLSGPYAEEAPGWLLEAAVAADLERAQEPYYFDTSLSLAVRALGHPSCTTSLRDQVLKQCSPHQLALLAGPSADDRLASAVARTLRSLSGTTPLPMTPDLLEKPTPAQVMFAQGRLHDLVFEAARDVLPTAPHSEAPQSGEDTEAWLDRHKAAHRAWESMWRRVLTRHPDRQRQFVEWASDGTAGRPIHDVLLGVIPWTVDPALLTELAKADLERFHFNVLLAQGCRMRRDGADQEEILDRLASELTALPEEQRTHFRESLTRTSTYLLDWGCRAPVHWAQSSASDTWHHLLNPAQAKDGYREVEWRAPAETLAALAALFAETAARALPYWEPRDRYSAITPDDVGWVRDMLLHLPAVTEDVVSGIRPIIRDARTRLSRHHPSARPRYDEVRRIEEILGQVERILADPPPEAGSWRRVALGDPKSVTVRELAAVQEQALSAYLDRHPGDDSLVEKALLSLAASGCRSSTVLADVLRRHSSAESVLLRLTTDLRKELGGGPSWREAWTRMLLNRPGTGPELVRALPAWSALRARGDRYDSAHPAVVSVVFAALGTDEDAWKRFVNSPASHAGATAWLRLGDLLDAACTGALWPKPPGTR
ncbi:hypothetical protein [Streptomyces sp. UNOC14_S4]|uniref:hypothetical protein n=1 Tax=Streptomyces sp. UNOC14_S4 TaxID=2872340 RepID=UPI001E52A98E|nr:hypothetical protein [Streptomyces sp. UNOC14_S4]MCC3770876.1 hypothetical protein [Streptomyces sp. UNOC14_S4]